MIKIIKFVGYTIFFVIFVTISAALFVLLSPLITLFTIAVGTIYIYRDCFYFFPDDEENTDFEDNIFND